MWVSQVYNVHLRTEDFSHMNNLAHYTLPSQNITSCLLSLHQTNLVENPAKRCMLSP